jgi:hypothetical protein
MQPPSSDLLKLWSEASALQVHLRGVGAPPPQRKNVPIKCFWHLRLFLLTNLWLFNRK